MTPPGFDAILDRARDIADTLLFPAAQEIDQSDRLPARHLEWLAEAGLLGLAIPFEHGGLGAPPEAVIDYLEIISGACGVTNFVQLQHLLGCGMIAWGQNEALKREMLPTLARGEQRLSLGFSQVRRPGPPMVRAEPRPGGWVLDGTVPWLTGWGLMDEAVFGATLPDDRLLFALAPLREGPELRPGPSMRLCVVTASATVSAQLTGLWVPFDRHVQILTRDEMAQRDAFGLPVAAAFSLGVARRCVRQVRELVEARHAENQLKAVERLGGEIERVRTGINACLGRVGAPGYVEEALRHRAWAIELGVRCAHAYVAAAGGSANLLTHPAQRLMREAMLYTLTAQTRDLQSMTLDRLAPAT